MKIVYNGEMDERLCKAVLGETIPAILESDPDAIYLDADLMSCIGTLKYGAAHRDRAIDCGIAEANMAGVAAGLAMAGFKPITGPSTLGRSTQPPVNPATPRQSANRADVDRR